MPCEADIAIYLNTQSINMSKIVNKIKNINIIKYKFNKKITNITFVILAAKNSI